MEILNVGQVIDSIDGSLCPGGDKTRVVDVCGANCPGQEAVTFTLRSAGISVDQRGCLGSQGCGKYGTLEPSNGAAYVSVPQRTDDGVEFVEAVAIARDLPVSGNAR